MVNIDDFKSTQGRLDPGNHPEALAAWNQFLGNVISPSLVAEILCTGMSAYEMRNRLAFRLRGKARLAVLVSHPGATPVIAKAERSIDHMAGIVTHDSMRVIPAWQGRRIGRSLVNNHVNLYIAFGYELVHLVAAGEGGGYAWARAGFEPYPDEWSQLSQEIENRLVRLAPTVDPDVLNACKLFLSLGPRESLWSLADIDQTYLGRPLGSLLLRGTRWSGTLNLHDGEALARLNDWVNREGLT